MDERDEQMMKRYALILTVVLAAALLLFGTAAYADILVSNGMDSSAKLATGSTVTFTVNCDGLDSGSYENYLVDLTYDADVLGEPKLASSSIPSGWTLFKGQAGKGKVTFLASDEKMKNASGKGLSLEIVFKVTGISEKDKAFTTSVAVSGAYAKNGTYVLSETDDSVEMTLLGGVPVGTVLADDDGSEYIVTGDKEVSFFRANSKASTKTIPATYKKSGMTFRVTGISDKAFYNSKIKSVTIGKNVRKIGESAFEGCAKLTKIALPAKVEFIGAKAFFNCKALKQVDVKTANLTDSSAVGKNAFTGTPKRMQVTIHTRKPAVFRDTKSTFLKRGASKTAVFKMVK